MVLALQAVASAPAHQMTPIGPSNTRFAFSSRHSLYSAFGDDMHEPLSNKKAPQVGFQGSNVADVTAQSEQAAHTHQATHPVQLPIPQHKLYKYMYIQIMPKNSESSPLAALSTTHLARMPVPPYLIQHSLCHSTAGLQDLPRERRFHLRPRVGPRTSKRWLGWCGCASTPSC